MELVLLRLLFFQSLDIGIARPVGGARRRAARRAAADPSWAADQPRAVAIVDVLVLVLVAAEAETEAEPTQIGAAPSSPAHGRRRRRRATTGGGERRARRRPPFKPEHAIAENPSSRSPRRAQRARKRPLRISGWPDNPANPRRERAQTRSASAAERALLPRRGEKWDSPRLPIAISRFDGLRPAHGPPARPEPGAAGRIAPKRPSTISSATPRLIAASARLKTKKWRPNACRSRKSTTAP